MRAGAASVDITPTDVKSTFVAGFGMGKRATGVHMPLRASAVYIEADDGHQVVLVSLDLVGLLNTWIQKIRGAVTAIDGERVIVSCTHTHAGPDTLGYWGPSFLKIFPVSDGKQPSYMHALVTAVADCVDQAVHDARPATFRAVSFEGDPSWNRNDRGGAPYDHVVAAALDSDKGRVATIVNYASHPEVLWEHNTLLSPDYVGPLRATVQRETGGELVFLNGPLGAMLTPNCQADEKDLDARTTYIDTFGETLGHAVVGALKTAETTALPTLSHDPLRIRLANENWRYKLLEKLGFVDVVTQDNTIESIAHALTLGSLSIATFPGEPCPELGARIRAAMTGTHRMVVGLCEDEFGYILEPAMFDDKTYAYEQTMSLGRATADIVVDALSARFEAMT